MIDPIVEEARNYRAQHARRFNSNLLAIGADLEEIAATCGPTVVSLPPRTLDITTDQLEPSDQGRQAVDVHLLSPRLSLSFGPSDTYQRKSV